jgi:hypothetical protein
MSLIAQTVVNGVVVMRPVSGDDEHAVEAGAPWIVLSGREQFRNTRMVTGS